MVVNNFATADDLTQYVNDNSIPQASIVTVLTVEARWYLFHYDR